MSGHFRLVALPALLTLSACLPDVVLETDAQKASYGIGFNIGKRLASFEEHVDMAAVMKGVTDALSEQEAALTEEEMAAAMAALDEMIQAGARERGTAEGEEFLERNAAREGVIVTESGLQYEVLREGDGASPGAGQRAVVHYRGSLPDGTEFDTSYGGDPVSFAVDEVVPGFSEALKLMKVGGHMRVALPSEIAYGEEGRQPVIGPNQVLVFEIEMLGIEE
ncbi:MAG: FKBP-type peptidyl-prolyl cis-trans isomerase [Gemmatimonadota bacterium]|nr:FKBP-type peptidyl-prolyl cis-trans isomerase [Gemmatimonadota bacterium]MDE2873728.1 FKBP-type peptidyl-prolyl cis-trans isomerase [Gemmatimonadota bacterium]